MARFDPSRPVTTTLHNLLARQDDDADCPRRYLTAIFYPDLESMRAGAHRYNARHGFIQDAGVDTALGMVQVGNLAQHYDRRRKVWVDTTKRHIAVIRLARGHLTPEVLAHEAMHAASHLEKVHQWAAALAQGDQAPEHTMDDDNEEAIATVVGQITNILARDVHMLVTDGWCDPPGYLFRGEIDTD